MTDVELMEKLLALSEDERLSDEESDMLVMVVRILEKKEKRKGEALAAIRSALHSVGNT